MAAVPEILLFGVGGGGGVALTAAGLSTDGSKHKRDGGSSWVSIRDRILTDRRTFLV